MEQKKTHKKNLKKLLDFTIEDIINAPRPKPDIRHVDGVCCLHCGSTRIRAIGTVKVFRGQRMQPYRCFACSRDFYKED